MLTTSSVPVFRPYIPDSASHAIQKCLGSGWLGYGAACKELEARFSDRGGFALATSSCTAALHLAGLAIRQSDEDEVIVPAITFVSTAMAFLAAGYRVVTVDVAEADLMLDLTAVRNAITARTRAVVAVHLYGQRYDTSELRALCDSHGIALIEDCAHRLDLDDGVPPQGDFACYSFNAVKEAPGGEGGMVWCRSEEHASRMRAQSNVGMTVDTVTRSAQSIHLDYAFGTQIGLKLRCNDITASLVMALLEIASATRASRRQLCETYYDALLDQGFGDCALKRSPNDSFLMYVIRVRADARTAIRRRFAESGVATSVHYPSLSLHPRVMAGACPVAEAASQQVITLPTFPYMTATELERVQSALRNVQLVSRLDPVSSLLTAPLRENAFPRLACGA